jgi:hypothetical protein
MLVANWVAPFSLQEGDLEVQEPAQSFAAEDVSEFTSRLEASSWMLRTPKRARFSDPEEKVPVKAEFGNSPCWIPIPTNLAPSLVTSSLYGITEVTNQSFVSLNFIQRVGSCILFHLLAISAQLTVCLLTTGLLYLSLVLLRASMRACLLYRDICLSQSRFPTHYWIPAELTQLESCSSDLYR